MKSDPQSGASKTSQKKARKGKSAKKDILKRSGTNLRKALKAAPEYRLQAIEMAKAIPPVCHAWEQPHAALADELMLGKIDRNEMAALAVLVSTTVLGARGAAFLTGKTWLAKTTGMSPRLTVDVMKSLEKKGYVKSDYIRTGTGSPWKAYYIWSARPDDFELVSGEWRTKEEIGVPEGMEHVGDEFDLFKCLLDRFIKAKALEMNELQNSVQNLHETQ